MHGGGDAPGRVRNRQLDPLVETEIGDEGGREERHQDAAGHAQHRTHGKGAQMHAMRHDLLHLLDLFLEIFYLAGQVFVALGHTTSLECQTSPLAFMLFEQNVIFLEPFFIRLRAGVFFLQLLVRDDAADRGLPGRHEAAEDDRSHQNSASCAR